jgi:hypothetical protein
MPVPVFERDEFRSTNSGDRFVAGEAAFREELPEAFCAIRLLVAAGEALSC